MTAPGHDVVRRLRAAGCVFAEEEARLLGEAAATTADLEALVARRVAGEPLEQLLGWAEFCGLRIAVAPGVFVPRRRTEFLVETAVALVHAGAVVLDLCCGSGAVGAALLAAVPGGNDGLAGGTGCVVGTGASAAGAGSSERPANSDATTTTRITASAPSTIQADRLLRSSACSVCRSGAGAGGRGGASTGDFWTVTPGPAGVATSDQPFPLHQRTRPGVPSGSGYQPDGGACPAPVTGSA